MCYLVIYLVKVQEFTRCELWIKFNDCMRSLFLKQFEREDRTREKKYNEKSKLHFKLIFLPQFRARSLLFF